VCKKLLWSYDMFFTLCKLGGDTIGVELNVQNFGRIFTTKFGMFYSYRIEGIEMRQLGCKVRRLLFLNRY